MYKPKEFLQDRVDSKFYSAAGAQLPESQLPESAASDHPAAQTGKVHFFEVRDNEPAYAFLPQPKVTDKNRYGDAIDLIARSGGEAPQGREMRINEKPGCGSNPNRNLQHGFHFTADNCIGCHACEAACSEKNDNPPHIAFRSVGYVEGGTYPAYKRLNISMACNHCDDPVCLKGCPTGAYTKHAEYGAVLQDPDTCFGCGYCTWVCPYNAPQLDPIKGQVSKCNMCVDRLEEGLKPACVTACLGNALDFGVIDNTPENREQIKTTIPGFPDPEITHPNIRFQQTRSLPDEMGRTDSQPIKYHKGVDGEYRSVVDQKRGKAMDWNLARLSSRENPLVIFTLSAQMAIGAFLLVFIGPLLGVKSLLAFQQSSLYAPLTALCLGLVGAGLFMSTLHLGKPLRFYRGFNNLRHSPVCREGLGIAVFMAGLGLHTLFALPQNPWLQRSLQGWLDLNVVMAIETSASISLGFGLLAVPAGLAGIYYMNKCYRIPARPFWNHWQVATSFFGTLFSLGTLLVAVAVVGWQMFAGDEISTTLPLFAVLIALGIVAEGIGLVFHAGAMNKANNEGGAAHYVQCTTFGKSYWLRNGLMGVSLLLLTVLAAVNHFASLGNVLIVTLGLMLLVSMATSSIIGRALFYVLVIPTTMPGAFFWKNKAFEEHAREMGLAHMPQVGVVYDRH